MNKQLMRIVLPRLAKRLQRQLDRYRAGDLNDAQFTRVFEDLLQRQYIWLTDRGVSDVKAAIAIHGAVLVLSGPGLRSEAEEIGVPLEVIEHRAVQAAATDLAQNYGLSQQQAVRVIADIVAKYAD